MPDGQKVSWDKEFISHIEALQKAKHRPNFVTLQVCSQDLWTRDRERTEGYPRVVDMQSRLSLWVKPNHPNTESFHMYRVVFPDSHILDVPISLNHFEAHWWSSEDMHRMTQEVLQRDFFKQITQAWGNVSHIDEQTLSNCFFRSARGSMDFPNNSGFLSTHMKWPGMNPFRDLLDAGCDKVWEWSIDEAAEIFAWNGTLELHEWMIIVFSYDLPHWSRKDGTYIPAVFGREYHSGVVVPADPRSWRKWDFLCDFGFLPYEVSGPIDMIANEYQYWLKWKSYGSRVTNFTIELYRGKWGAR